MKRLKLLFIFFLVFTKNISAQDTLSPKVIYLGSDPITLDYSSIKVSVEGNKIPIDSAVVEIQYKKSAVGIGWTDKQGNCTIKSIPIGSVSVIIKKKNYKTVQVNDIKTADGKTVFINIELVADQVKKKGVRLVPVK